MINARLPNVNFMHSLNFSFFVGYETRHKMIAMSYISSLVFIFDVLAVIPIEVFAFFDHHNTLDFAVALKMNRALKLWKVQCMSVLV